MFASANRSNVSARQAGAYRQMHATTGVASATPHGLVTMLFDGLIGTITEARGAMRAGNLPGKVTAISRALGIVDEGLSATLNLKDGGRLAADLHDLYAYVALRLTHANLRNDEAALEECTRLIEPVRSAWAQIADQVPA